MGQDHTGLNYNGTGSHWTELQWDRIILNRTGDGTESRIIQDRTMQDRMEQD